MEVISKQLKMLEKDVLDHNFQRFYKTNSYTERTRIMFSVLNNGNIYYDTLTGLEYKNLENVDVFGIVEIFGKNLEILKNDWRSRLRKNQYVTYFHQSAGKIVTKLKRKGSTPDCWILEDMPESSIEIQTSHLQPPLYEDLISRR